MTTERDELAKCGTELAKAMRGAKTLGEIIEKQCRDVLNVTGLHHLINADGDGQWDVVWMRLFEMRDELAGLKESTIGRERLRGDSWRDRAQEMEVLRDAAVERAEAALSERDRHVIPPEAVDAARVKLEDVLGGRFDDLDAIRQILEAAAPHMHAYLLAELRDRDEKLAEAWDRGFASGKSRAMRAMSDEPGLPLTAPNPFRAAVAAANGGES